MSNILKSFEKLKDEKPKKQKKGMFCYETARQHNTISVSSGK